MPHQMTIPGEEIAIFCISMTKIIFRISLLFSGKWDYIFYVSGFGEFHFKSQWSRLEQEVKMKKAEYRIFYAEDNTVKLLAVSRAMKSMGYNIEKSESNLEDALKEVIRARDEGEPYDILMTDMNYPLKNGGTSTNEAGPTFISKVKEHGISVRGVAVTRFDGHPAAREFAKTIEDAGCPVFYHYPIKGYPNDLDTIVCDSGYGRNDYIPTEKPIVVVTGPGPGSGKFATCLTMLYHEVKRGSKADYAKFETFPVWNLPLMHPLNVAYEAATLELKDENQIDPHHFRAYGEIRVNYNRDVEAYPILREIWERMMGEECPYRSPTDMGVNRIASGIVNDVVVRAASREECVRRYERVKADFDEGRADMNMLARALTVMAKAD